MCQEKSYPNILTALQPCVVAAGFSWTPIAECWGDGKGALGTQLVLANAARTAALVPPHNWVPWVTVNGKPIGETPNDNLLSEICAAYVAAGGSAVPAACSAPRPVTRLRAAKASVCMRED